MTLNAYFCCGLLAAVLASAMPASGQPKRNLYNFFNPRTINDIDSGYASRRCPAEA